MPDLMPQTIAIMTEAGITEADKDKLKHIVRSQLPMIIPYEITCTNPVTSLVKDWLRGTWFAATDEEIDEMYEGIIGHSHEQGTGRTGKVEEEIWAVTCLTM